MKLDKFHKAIIFSIALLAIVAVMDYQTYPASFWLYSLVLGGTLAMSYYWFKKDKSETLAIFLAFVIMLYTGLEDLIFYIIGWNIPSSIPHLYTHPVIGFVAKTMGLSTVTPLSLIISVAIGGLIVYFLSRYLKDKW